MPTENAEPTDLKTPEWEVFIDPESVERSRDFQLRVAKPPKRYAKYFEKIVLAEHIDNGIDRDTALARAARELEHDLRAVAAIERNALRERGITVH